MGWRFSTYPRALGIRPQCCSVRRRPLVTAKGMHSPWFPSGERCTVKTCQKHIHLFNLLRFCPIVAPFVNLASSVCRPSGVVWSPGQRPEPRHVATCSTPRLRRLDVSDCSPTAVPSHVVRSLCFGTKAKATSINTHSKAIACSFDGHSSRKRKLHGIQRHRRLRMFEYA